MVSDKLFSEFVEVYGTDSRTYMLPHFAKGHAHKQSGLSQQFDFTICSVMNHISLSKLHSADASFDAA